MSSTTFRKQYPDFASIEYQIRQAHAERSLYIATAIAEGIARAVRSAGRLFAKSPDAKAQAARA